MNLPVAKLGASIAVATPPRCVNRLARKRGSSGPLHGAPGGEACAQGKPPAYLEARVASWILAFARMAGGAWGSEFRLTR